MDSQNLFKKTKIEKPEKGSKHQRHEKYNIRVKITRAKYQVCYVMITEVINLRKDIKIDEKFRVPMIEFWK